MNTHAIILLAVAFIVVAYIVWFYSRSRALLQRWAATNCYEILHAELRNFRRGPLLWTSSKNQAIYLVRVRDQAGQERTGWLCLGEFWTGLFSTKAEIKWENGDAHSA